MYHFSKKYILLIVGGAMVVSLQGCDQISKLTDYMSPGRAPQQKKEAPQKIVKETVSSQKTSPSPQEAPIQESTMSADTLVQIGGWSLSIQKFNKRLEAVKNMASDFDASNVDQKKYILSELVQQQLLVQEAISQKIDQTEEFQAALEDLRNTVLVQALIGKVAEGITATEEETEAFYKENPDFFKTLKGWKVSEIVVDTEEKAKNILVGINQGGDFAAAAKANSMAQSAASGGDLGFLTISTGDQNLDQHVFPFEKMAQIVSTLDVGGVSGAFKGPEGFYIVKLLETQGGELQPLEGIKEELKQYIISSKQQQKLLEILAEAEKKFNVNINEQLLEE